MFHVPGSMFHVQKNHIPTIYIIDVFNLEHGTWNPEHGTWNMEHETIPLCQFFGPFRQLGEKFFYQIPCPLVCKRA